MESLDPGVRAELQKLQHNQTLTPAQAARLAQHAARACLFAPRAMDEGVAVLCELALEPEAEPARIGTEAIFRQVVEPMGDAFEPRLCDLYIQFMARVVERCREAPAGKGLDQRLRRFGLGSEGDLIQRAERVRQVRRAGPGVVKKALVLSRVTLGADVAVTSVVLRKLLRAYPGAQVVLVGSRKAASLFAGEPRVEGRLVEYPRGGGLLERMAVWERVVEAIADEIRGLGPGEYVVVDPDSRLTQLGMLPVVEDESAYHFFESRSFAHEGRQTLGALTAAWAGEVFGGDPEAEPRPWVSLPAEALEWGRRTAGEGRRWVSVNLGVGENPRKRIGGEFEERLLAGLRDQGWRIFLDTGEGGEERVRVERLAGRLRAAGCGEDEIVIWRGSLAGFGALIAASKLYVGYDSACQHLAAALGVPAIDIFAGYSSPRVPERWRPWGPATVTTVVAEPQGAEPEKVLRRVLEEAR